MRQELRLVSSELIEVEGRQVQPSSLLSVQPALVLVRQSEIDSDVLLHPEEARRLAAMLTAAADFAEGTTAT